MSWAMMKLNMWTAHGTVCCARSQPQTVPDSDAPTRWACCHSGMKTVMQAAMCSHQLPLLSSSTDAWLLPPVLRSSAATTVDSIKKCNGHWVVRDSTSPAADICSNQQQQARKAGQVNSSDWIQLSTAKRHCTSHSPKNQGAHT